jgi:hypothetical protein
MPTYDNSWATHPLHGLINYKDTKAKCRHLKKLSCILRHMFIRVYRLEIQCPSPLLSGSTLPPSPFPVWISILYTRIQCVRWGFLGCGPQTDKHLPQSLFTGQFFRWRHFALPSMILLRSALFIREGSDTSTDTTQEKGGRILLYKHCI